MNRAQLIREVDEFVYDLELNGVSEEDTVAAMKEYIEILEDIARA